MATRDVLQLVSRDLVRDPRALRAAKVARDAGLSVTAMCMLTRGTQPTAVDGIDVVGVRGSGWSAVLRQRTAPGRGSRGPTTELRGLWRIARHLSWALKVRGRAPRSRVVHAHDLETLPAALALRTPRVIYDAHELYADWEPAPSRLYKRYCLLLERNACRRAHATVTVNESIAGVLAARYGIPRPLVILNVPDTPRASTPLDPPASRPLVLYQGVFAEPRGLDAVLQAARLVPEVEVHLRGFGPDESRLRERAAVAGVRVIDPVSPQDLATSLAGYHIGLVPYLPVSLNYRLCLPNKLFEYLAGGMAVVASDLPELRRVVDETGAGIVFEPGDPESLAAALRTLAQPEELARARERALRAATGVYAWEPQRAQLEELYRSACVV